MLSVVSKKMDSMPKDKRTKENTITQLDLLKPKEKHHLIDIVSSVGIDVSDWANFKKGATSAASNPKYCYEWAFIEPSRLVVLNLWHHQLKEEKGFVCCEINKQNSSLKGVRKSRWNRFHLAIQEIVKNNLVVRVIINSRTIVTSKNKKRKASSVEFRMLDPIPWVVKSYDVNSGDCLLVRGELSGRYVDQFSFPQVTVNENEHKTVTNSIYVRNPELGRRALERAKGKCEYCGTSGFVTSQNKIYLETHHVIPLGEDGPDSEKNIVAICAKDHREAHYGIQSSIIREKLLKKLKEIFPN